MTKKVGRPPKDGVTRSEKVEIRVTPEVKEVLQRAAETKGVTVSDYVLGVAVDMARSIAEGGTPAEVYYSLVMGAGTIEPRVVEYSASAEHYKELRNKHEGET